MLFIGRLIASVSITSVLATAVAAQSAAAPTPPRPRLLGVYDAATGNPIQAVEVTDMLTDITIRTPVSGLVSLSFLPVGRSMVSIRKLGFSAETLFVSISPRDTAPITVILNQLTSLDAVVITDSATQHTSANLRGFEERRRTGNGHFVTEAQLRKDDGMKLSRELGRIPGLTVSIRGDVRSARGGCRPDVFIDGVRTNPAGRGTPALGDMEVNDFAAIEYYGIGQVPAQYNQIGAGCGAILLWTRER
jgi:hypothetical protein